MCKFKTNLFYALCLLLGISAFTACSDDNAEPSVNPGGEISGVTDQELADIQVVDSGRTSWHDHYSAMLKEAQQGNSEEDSLAAAFATRQLEVNDSLTDVYLESLGANGDLPDADGDWGKNDILGYKYVVLRYKTIDKDGKPIECSELVVGPYNKLATDSIPNPDNIVIGCHVTITSDNRCPSQTKTLNTDVGMLIGHARYSFQMGVNENLVIIPDYQGYGLTHKDPHPYLSQDLTARQVLDGVIAGKKWFEKNGAPLEKDFQTIALGYSQGGSVAMAVHRYIEKNNLSNMLNFAGSICGDGPYDPVATLKEYISNDRIYMPVAVALIIKGMCDANHLVAGKYSPSDYLTDSFLKSGILDWLVSKDYTTKEIQEKFLAYSMNNDNGFVMMRKSATDNKYLPYLSSNMQTADGKKRNWVKASTDASCYCTVDQVLRPEVIEYFKKGSVETPYMAKMTAIHDALEMNNLTQGGWMPQHPLFVFHSEHDEVVPIVNYKNINCSPDYFTGIIYTSESGTHEATGTTFYFLKESSYFKSILSNTWKRDYPNSEYRI